MKKDKFVGHLSNQNILGLTDRNNRLKICKINMACTNN